MRYASSFAVIGFLVGFIVGIIFWNGVGIAAAQHDYWKRVAIIRVGELLDTDVVYLKSGNWLSGRIVSETASGIEFRMPKEVRKIDREDINKIDYNTYSRYLKEMW